jgi:predicted RNA-binding Zn-ribbon protein involved in translation (DUF1610 family)
MSVQQNHSTYQQPGVEKNANQEAKNSRRFKGLRKTGGFSLPLQGGSPEGDRLWRLEAQNHAMATAMPAWAVRSRPIVCHHKEAAMQRLHFHCPKTGEVIDVGIESELDTLLRIRDKRVLARCPRCGERHEWRVAEAQLQKAA